MSVPWSFTQHRSVQGHLGKGLQVNVPVHLQEWCCPGLGHNSDLHVYTEWRQQPVRPLCHQPASSLTLRFRSLSIILEGDVTLPIVQRI